MADEESPGRVERVNDTQIYFEVRGTGEPLVLLHGFTGSSQDWKVLPAKWRRNFRLIVPDLRGHGRSEGLSKPFRHDEAAADVLAVLDCLKIESCKGLGISGGGNILLHLATKRPELVKAMVLVSATSYFPEQARQIMREFPRSVPEAQWDVLRGKHPGGDRQIEALLSSASAFAESYDDMNFTPPYLARVEARTLIVQGDRDPFYPVAISVEMAKAIPRASLWVVPDGGHVPVIGDRWGEFLRVAGAFLRA